MLLPVKIGDGTYQNPNNAILTLVLALALPVDKAVRMAETLLSLGATSSQADMNGVTAFHRYIQGGKPELIECLWENDKIGLKAAINHIAIDGNYYNNTSTTPLMSAVANGDPILVLKLLDAGAQVQIDFDSWLKSARHSFEDQLRVSFTLKFSATLSSVLYLASSSHPNMFASILPPIASFPIPLY